MWKLLLITICLLAITGVAFANFTGDFQIDFPDIAKYFQVLLSGNLVQNISTTQGTLKYFGANGSGFQSTPNAATSLFDVNCTNCQIALEVIDLNEMGCDIKAYFDGTELDVNMEQKKMVFTPTTIGQRLSLGAYMNLEGRCAFNFKDLNVLVQ